MKRWYSAGKTFEKLCDYLDGDLDGPESAAIEDAVVRDAEERHRLQQARLLVKSLHQLPRVKTSDTFDAVLRARLRKEAMQRQGWFSAFDIWERWRLPAVAVAALLMLAMGFYAGSRSPVSPALNAGMVSQTRTSALPPPSPAGQPVNVYIMEHFIDPERVAASAAFTDQREPTQANVVHRDSVRRPILRPVEPGLTINNVGTGVQF